MSWDGDLVHVPDANPADFDLEPGTPIIAFAPSEEAVAAGTGAGKLAFTGCASGPVLATVDVVIKAVQ